MERPWKRIYKHSPKGSLTKHPDLLVSLHLGPKQYEVSFRSRPGIWERDSKGHERSDQSDHDLAAGKLNVCCCHKHRVLLNKQLSLLWLQRRRVSSSPMKQKCIRCIVQLSLAEVSTKEGHANLPDVSDFLPVRGSVGLHK